MDFLTFKQAKEPSPLTLRTCNHVWNIDQVSNDKGLIYERADGGKPRH